MTQENSTRPWGKYEVLSSSPGYKIKKITIKPKCRISYQSHAQRNEIWVVVQGNGSVTLDDKVSKVKYNSIICIPQGAKHRIENRSADYDLKLKGKKKLFLNKKELYLESVSGNMSLVEVFADNDTLSIMIGEGKRYDITLESAFDLADALMMVANEEYERVELRNV
jgi:mannose-6-phosphate isomerase